MASLVTLSTMNASKDTRFFVGQAVIFGRSHGEKTMGEIVKINAKTVKVRQTEARGTHPAGTVWNVSKSLILNPIGEEIAPHTPEASTEARIMEEIRQIYCNLSPENLHMDGEASPSQVRKTAALLKAKLKACFGRLGRVVSEGEAFRGV